MQSSFENLFCQNSLCLLIPAREKSVSQQTPIEKFSPSCIKRHRWETKNDDDINQLAFDDSDLTAPFDRKFVAVQLS